MKKPLLKGETMFRKVQQEKYMIFLRYAYMFIFLISFLKEYERIDSKAIVLLLIYLVNNQLRYFILPERKACTVPSLMFETVVCWMLLGSAGTFGVSIFVPVLIDVICMFNAAVAFTYAIGTMILVLAFKDVSMATMWAMAAVPILLLLVRVKDEEDRKLEAQQLYDKLREKDEELKRANKELEAYANTVEEITLLRERNRISREIHDNVGHALSTMIIQLGAMERVSRVNGEEASKMAATLAGFAKESMERVRGAVRAMKPRELEEYEGIVAISEMIKNFEKLTGIEVSMRVSDKVWKLNSDQTMVIYRVIQEFLSNSIRHGKATKVKIFLNFSDTHLRVHLKDNGVGCSKVVSGIGLQSIKERVSAWGGDVECFSEDGKGFELAVSMDKVKLSMDGA